MDAARASNRTFEEYDPKVEWSRAADADAVKIALPGFKREEIRVLVDNHGHLRTRGERQLAGASGRWSRFQKDFQLPPNCNVDGIRAKFENEMLTITLPKRTPSPPQADSPVSPPVPQPRWPAPEPAQRLPAPPPQPVPAAPLAPATSQKLPAAPSQRQPAEHRPSMPRKPPAAEPAPPRLPSVPTPPEVEALMKKPYNGGGAATGKPEPAAVTKPTEQEGQEERRRVEMMAKVDEDRKATQEREKERKAKEEAEEEAAAMAAMEMARQPRPISASRGLLVNVAVAAVVLLGITVYLWRSLRSATGGHGHGGLGAGRDEM